MARSDSRLTAFFSRDRLRRVGKKLLALTVGFAIAFVMAECTLSIIGIGSPVFHRPDATYGNALIPGAEGWYVAEGKAYVVISGDGFRDIEHHKAKREGTIRIAVLGDSYAEALQVPMEQAFWSVLGTQLGHCAALDGKAVEMLNFGVSGFNTAQEYLLLQKRVWDYQPDIVLLAFLTANDVADNEGSLVVNPAPVYRFEGAELVLDSSRAGELGTGGRAALWLIRHSRMLQLLNTVRINWQQCGKLGRCGGDTDMKKGEAGLRNGVYLEPTDDSWRNAWRITEELLRRVRDEVAAHQARFFLVTLSNGIQVHPDPTVREAFRAEIGATDLLYPDRRIGAFAEREHIDALLLAPVLASQAEVAETYLHGFAAPTLGQGHWNKEGHRVAAETIAPWMCGELGRP